jgi:aldehyde:ferredoxin oxidoreductase
VQPILKINLSTNEYGTVSVPHEWVHDFLGGASLGARFLYQYLTKNLDPFSDQAPLLFINGPLSGTSGPATGRFVVCGKSPATHLWAESNVGGFWGPELRQTGYDGMWIEGKAETPVYIWLDDGRMEILRAGHLWGKDVYETQDLIKGEVGRRNARVATIGQAGERGVLYASICCDHGRMAGRTGLGAVMGSKNLKAIAVYGRKKIPVAQGVRFAAVRSAANRTLKQDNETKVLHELGTAGAANYSEYMGAMPAKYFHQGNFADVDQISGARMTEAILVGQSACHACIIACGRVVNLGDGAKRKGPEYETIVGFGPNLLINDLVEIARLNEMCDRYGMDTISMSNTIGLAFHLFEKGVLTKQDTGGLGLKWGDVAIVRQLVHMTANREGIGELLARGSLQFARAYHAEEEAVQVNGLEMAYHDPRGVTGMALSYATSPRGACHNQSDYFFVDWGHTADELGIAYFDRHAQAEKAGNVALHQNWRTYFNSAVVCIFANVHPRTHVELINAACDLDWDVDQLMKSGERSWNLKRSINIRLGLTGANDKLPNAILLPYQEGGSQGFQVDFNGMLRAYYEARGWDKTSGRPTKEKLRELGLKDIAADLWEAEGDSFRS